MVFLANEATDFIRADPEYDTGITGAMERPRVAEGVGVGVEFHASGPAQRHCIAVTRNTNHYQLGLVHPDCPNAQPPVYEGDYSDMIDAVDNDRSVPVPHGPGLGVDHNWEYIRDNQTGSVHTYE